MTSGAQARLDIRPEPGGGSSLVLQGRFDVHSTGQVWAAAMEAVGRPAPVVVDASAVEHCDGTGMGLLVELRRRGASEIRGLAPRFQALLDLFPKAPATPAAPPPPASLAEDVGRGVSHVFSDLVRQAAFVGELTAELGRALRRPGSVRWMDVLRTAEAAGVNALPIVAFVGLLVGVILAFQSAVPLRQFGAEVFVSELVTVAVLRELGPLMTAILVAGRSGSAFAAELGTMKVNEEVDALVTMGLAPVRFLALPRVIAAVAVMPVLTLFFDLMSMTGGAIVVGAFGYPPATFLRHAASVISVPVLAMSLLKTLVFGLVVAGVGCQRGLETGTGATAVGASATRSVVAGILLTILVDGIFAGIFFALDL
jgi:phospholipid/cholesterol/gamma-HCH transport system permease protein